MLFSVPIHHVQDCHAPHRAETVVLAGAGLTPVFVPRPDGTLYATVVEPAAKPTPSRSDRTDR